MLNISNKKFPTYKDNEKDINKDYLNSTDYYFIYKLNKKDIGKYLNTWFKGNVLKFKKTDDIINDEMITVKQTDYETSNSLYHKKYNPISINIMCPVGGKFTTNDKNEKLYQMKAQIHSIDDSSYGAWFPLNNLVELNNIRTKLMEWLNTKSEINGEEWIIYCQSLGADDIDYN